MVANDSRNARGKAVQYRRRRLAVARKAELDCATTCSKPGVELVLVNKPREENTLANSEVRRAPLQLSHVWVIARTHEHQYKSVVLSYYDGKGGYYSLRAL